MTPLQLKFIPLWVKNLPSPEERVELGFAETGIQSSERKVHAVPSALSSGLIQALQKTAKLFFHGVHQEQLQTILSIR